MKHIQPCPLAIKRLLNKPYENEVTLTRQKPPLNFDTIEKGNRSLNAENLRSIDQRASKLPAVKL